MKKMLKIIAMLLVIATVVFVAGCSGPETKEENKSVATESVHENESTAIVPAENASGNLSENATENATVVAVVDNMTADNESADNESAENETA